MYHCLSAKSSLLPESSCRRGGPVPLDLNCSHLDCNGFNAQPAKTGSTGGLLMVMQLEKRRHVGKIGRVNKRLTGRRASARQHQKHVAPLVRQHQITKDLNTDTLATEYTVLEYNGKVFELCLGTRHPHAHCHGGAVSVQRRGRLTGLARELTLAKLTTTLHSGTDLAIVPPTGVSLADRGRPASWRPQSAGYQIITYNVPRRPLQTKSHRLKNTVWPPQLQ